MSEKRKVFVSYSRADKDKVLPLVKNLEKNVGTKFWIDESGIDCAAQFLNVISKAIKDCQIVLFMLSDNSINGEWTQREIMFAKECGKRVVPVILDGRGLRDWTELYFVNVNYVDATNKSQLEKLSNEIVDWLEHESVVEPSDPKPDPPKPHTIDVIKRIMSRLVAPLKNVLSIIAVLLIILFVVGIYLVDDKEEVDEKEPQETEMEQGNDTIDSSSVNISVEPVVETVPTTKPTTTEVSSQKTSTPKAPITETPTENKQNINKEETTTTSPTASTTSSTTSQLATEDAIKVHAYVDLGLSVKWATCNVGANSPEEYGDYYAWGETFTKSSYEKSNSETWGKNIGDIGGTYRDVAHVKWGGNWRMPTRAEFNELLDTVNCTWAFDSLNGKMGYKITSLKNGNFIFLPAAGLYDGSSLIYADQDAYYWSSTASEGNNLGAIHLIYTFKEHIKFDARRYYGHTVRPVTE